MLVRDFWCLIKIVKKFIFVDIGELVGDLMCVFFFDGICVINVS